MKKRLLRILLTVCLLVGLLPTVALAVNNVSYLDSAENGTVTFLYRCLKNIGNG